MNQKLFERKLTKIREKQRPKKELLKKLRKCKMKFKKNIVEISSKDEI